MKRVIRYAVQSCLRDEIEHSIIEDCPGIEWDVYIQTFHKIQTRFPEVPDLESVLHG